MSFTFTLREYHPGDCAEMASLFYGTVHSVCKKDYTKKQLDAWADKNPDIAAWNTSFLRHNTLIAESSGRIIGFGDMDKNGYLNRLYIHKEYQSCGIGSAIVNALEKYAVNQGIMHFSVHASVTARSFFESKGYTAVRENTVVRHGCTLTNYIMEKEIR